MGEEVHQLWFDVHINKHPNREYNFIYKMNTVLPENKNLAKKEIISAEKF